MPSATMTSAHLPERSPSPSALSDTDPLQTAVRGGPFRALTQDRAKDPILAAGGDHSFLHAFEASEAAPAKRKHTGEWDDTDGDPRIPVRDKGDPLRRAEDPVSLGLISVEEGRRLFSWFFKSAHPFTPVLDPDRDTWER